MSTNAQLTQQISDLLNSWNTREDQFRAWLAGTSTGGPNGDGKYPLSDAAGNVELVACPALLEDRVAGPAADALFQRNRADIAAQAALAARTRARDAETQVISLHGETLTNRDLTAMYRDDAAAHAANALTYSTGASSDRALTVTARIAADAARDETLGYRDATLSARDETYVARDQTLVARDQAAAYSAALNPALLATKVELAAKAELVHGHSIADITGLQTALDGKASTGSYALVGHSHGVSDVAGLQSALDGKSPVASPTFTGTVASDGNIRGASLIATGVGSGWDWLTSNGLAVSGNAATYNAGVNNGWLAHAGSGKLRWNATSVTIFATDFITPKLRLTTPPIPASATAAGTKGDIAYDSSFVYVCVATNTWRRAALSTW